MIMDVLKLLVGYYPNQQYRLHLLRHPHHVMVVRDQYLLVVHQVEMVEHIV